ncbi:MAG: hypothetical protein KME28_26845 [Pelatocladus maniniholoensis HA4357-MV3]|jgi:hypothetical protein|uniref:Bacterial mobilisation domain-containing protein n=1 Tax=Pelatocladus maniniholoensis HA4357-MV3 TaxID=1117104 RepID=A0A9E3HF54_9NOST|nr:hypothetical protein [Pelatocladus maniniholoensis HA4357-MV3]
MPAKPKQHTIRFEMLLTKEQNEHWQALADSSGISKAELVRRSMAGCRIKTIPQANWQCYWQLLNIGTKINQIAKAQNSAIANGLIPPPIDPILFEELTKQINKLRLHLLLGSDEETNEELSLGNDWED